MLKRNKTHKIKIRIGALLCGSRKLAANITVLIISLSITLSSCQKKHEQFNRDKLTWFFKEFLLEHGGAYTLFGSKPMTIESLANLSPETLQTLEQYFKDHPEIEPIWVERHLEEGWEEWKKISPGFKLKHYILKEMTLNGENIVVLANIKNTVKTMKNHYSEFRRALHYDFIPELIVQDLAIKQNNTWSLILNDHVCKGLLFGYGVHNAHLFDQKIHEKNDSTEIASSENNDPRLPPEVILNNTPFRIPIFGIYDREESSALISQYKQQREQIKTYYQNKDFLEATIKKLCDK